MGNPDLQKGRVDKVKLGTVVILMVGGVLVYSAVKDKSPLDVFKMGLQGKSAPSQTTAPKNTPTQAGPPSFNNPLSTPGQVVTSI